MRDRPEFSDVIAISLAIGSSLAYGLSDFLGGLKSRSLPQLSVLLVSQVSASCLLIAMVIALGVDAPSGQFILYAALAGICEAVGVAALYRGLAIGSMSVVASVGATAPVVPVVVALAIGEALGPVQVIGILLAVGGVAIISYARQEGSLRVGPSLLFGTISALGFGGFFVTMAAASEGGVPWALLMARLSAVTAFGAVFIVRRPSLGVRPAEAPVLLVMGALIVGADAMYAIATTQGLLSIVAVLSSMYPVVTIALARAYLHERITQPQRVGIAIVFGGVAALAASSA